MHRIEDILDQAVNRVKNGEEISTVLLSYQPELREQLSANLNLVKIGLSLPKIAVPVPTKRMLFLDATPQAKAARFSEFFNVWAMALTAIILVIGGISFAAANSLPGDHLFALKRSFEEAQLKLARNPEEQAKLQLTFANARLEEVNQILAQKNLTQANTALAELNSQTQQALQNIQEIAAANPGVAKDPAIVSSVKSLASNQAQLVTKVAQNKSDAQIQASTKNTVANIQKLLAATSDQTSADLPTNTSITASGQVMAISEKSVTVDKNTFEIDSNTLIQDKDGNTITVSGIGLDDTIHINGHIKDQINIAEKIILEQKAPVEKPKVTQPAPQPTVDPDLTPTQTQDTFGGFIPEAAVTTPPAN